MIAANTNSLEGLAAIGALPANRGWRIANEAEVKGKTVVGLLVTDEGGWREPFGSLTKQVGRDHWGPGISKLNESLAAKGKAIEIAIVESKAGYLDFMPWSSQANPGLKMFDAIFHGSGFDGNENIRIGRNTGWNVNDSDTEMGFRNFNRMNISMEARMNDYSTYCAPASGQYRVPIPLDAFKHLLE